MKCCQISLQALDRIVACSCKQAKGVPDAYLMVAGSDQITTEPSKITVLLVDKSSTVNMCAVVWHDQLDKLASMRESVYHG
jgi:hypothetical protein